LGRGGRTGLGGLFGGKEDGDKKKLPEESRKAKIKLRRKMVGIEVKRLSV
jgi:hypothetical protein